MAERGRRKKTRASKTTRRACGAHVRDGERASTHSDSPLHTHTQARAQPHVKSCTLQRRRWRQRQRARVPLLSPATGAKAEKRDAGREGGEGKPREARYKGRGVQYPRQTKRERRETQEEEEERGD